MLLVLFSGHCNKSFFALFNVAFESSYWCIFAIFNAGKFATSFFFLGTYNLFMWSLGRQTSCIVVSFLVFWLICLSSLLVIFKNAPEYLLRGTAMEIIPLIRFLLQSVVSRNFIVRLRYSFVIFLLFPLVWWYPLPVFSNTWFLSWFGSSIPSVTCLFPTFFLARFHPFNRIVYSYFCAKDSNSFFHFLQQLYYSTHCELLTPVSAGGISLESEWQQVSSVSWTLLSIQPDLNNSAVWMISIFLRFFRCSKLLSNPFRSVPSTPVSIGSTITLNSHSFFSSLAKSKYLSFFSVSLIFTL